MRPALRLPLLQAVRLKSPPRSYSTCLHNLPLRPPRPRPSHIQCLTPIRIPHGRHKGTFASNARTLFRHHPVSVTFALLTILAGAGSLVYANYLYQTYILAAFHNYPEPVAKKLRRALFYTNTDLQPQQALKYYRQALQVAEEVGMDPFSDEIMGVKIQVAKLMEMVHQPGKAVQVLEILRRDGLEWVRRFGDDNRKKRTMVLSKCVQVSVKLAELYGSPEVWDRDMAEERLVWAVETAMKESQRRENFRVTEDEEGPWMSESEMGATFEALAHTYEEKDRHYLAAPLFLQALSLHPPRDCHTVILMNNLSSSLAQQSPRAARAAQEYASSTTISAAPVPTATRESLIANAQTWAQKALDVAAGITPPERNEECDVGCAVATHNLGEFAEMLGDGVEARRRYVEARSIAAAIGFREGVERSSARLRKLDGG